MTQNRFQLQTWIDNLQHLQHQLGKQFTSELHTQQRHLHDAQKHIQKQVHKSLHHDLQQAQKDVRKQLQHLQHDAQQQLEKVQHDVGSAIHRENRRMMRRFDRQMNRATQGIQPKGRPVLSLLGWSLGLLAIGGIGFLAARRIKEEQALRSSLKSDPGLDLKKFSGKWFEVAHLGSHLKNPYGLTVSYTLGADEQIEVVAQWREGDAEGKEMSETKQLQISDSQHPSRLQKQVLGPLKRPYWILEHGPHYEYAVIGSPDRKHLWILSRKPELDPELYDGILGRMEKQRFDITQLVQVPQDAHAPVALNTHLNEMLEKKKAYFKNGAEHQQHLGPHAEKRDRSNN